MGVRRVLRRALQVTASVTALAVLAACGGDDAGADKKPDAEPTVSTTPIGGGTTAEPALDPEHAVEPPGPREGVAALADIVVSSTETLSDETVKAIEQLEGVDSVERLALAQVIIENKSINVAAVDPATYRNYTPIASAETQAVWERVAAGELAMTRGLKTKLPQDDAGYLRLGGSKDATAIHVGAYAPQAAQIDMVVNPTWIDTLEMQPDNALLIRTGQVSPDTLRKPIEKIVAEGGSVQMVDAVARFGLDPGARQTAVVVGTVAEVVGVFNYTVLGGGRIAPDPSWVASHVATKAVPILGTVTCNRFVFPQLEAALQEIQERGLADEIHPDEYAGCYYPRFIAGSTSLSNHSFGLALDLNVPGNGRGTVGEMDREVVAIFKSWGFAWGGDWDYTDPMHFEMDELVEPQVVSSKQ